MRPQITRSERFSVWKAWDGVCFWCRELVQFQNTQIDHALPLDLENRPEEMRKIFEEYKVPDGFLLHSFENWVPACQGCNNTKRSIVIRNAPIFLVGLMQVRSKARLSQKIYADIVNNKKKGELLTKLAIAVEVGDITATEIEELLAGLPEIVRKAAYLATEKLLIGPGWEVLSANGDRQIVRSQYGVGVVPEGPIIDPSWYCPYCGSLGPWNGARCMSCGLMSEPD